MSDLNATMRLASGLSEANNLVGDPEFAVLGYNTIETERSSNIKNKRKSPFRIAIQTLISSNYYSYQ